MAIAKLPFNDKPYQKNDYPNKTSIDNTYIDELINGVIMPDGSLTRRPCLESYIDLGITKQIDGTYWWEAQSMLIIVCNGRIFKNADATGTVVEITGDGMIAGNQVSFDDDGDTLFMASGGRFAYTNGTAATAFIADADAPTAVDSIAIINGFLVANVSGTNTFQHSSPTNRQNWSALDIFTAEGNPDKIVTIVAKNRELYVFGERTIEIWFNTTGQFAFIRRDDVFLDFGCIAKYSAVEILGSMFWFTDTRKVMRLEGFAPKIISDGPNGIQTILDSMSTVSDAIGADIFIDRVGFYVISFPAEGRTFAYNYVTQHWSEWAYWKPDSTFRRFNGNSHAYASPRDTHYIGDWVQGRVYKFAFTNNDDFGDEVRFVRRTNLIDHGSRIKTKQSLELAFSMKRGFGHTSPPSSANTNAMPNAMLRWKNDNALGYSKPQFLPLGRLGEEQQIVSLKRMGQYRTRQYELSVTDRVPFFLYDVEEEFEVL